LPSTAQLSLWGAEKARIVVGRRGVTSRFTYAHELAHWAARLGVPEEVCSTWSPNEIRQFCDEFAGRLLVPNELLMASLITASIDPAIPFELTIPLVETLYRHIRAPMAAVIKRLDDGVREGRLRIANCAVLVCAARSAKRNSNYAPRILACCTPPEWFLPANKRLTTLGMSNLDRAFWEAEPLGLGFAVDRFTVWVREGWRKQVVERAIRYRIYEASKGQRAKSVMLALFQGPTGAH
jgi:hypothetical protein